MIKRLTAALVVTLLALGMLIASSLTASAVTCSGTYWKAIDTYTQGTVCVNTQNVDANGYQWTYNARGHKWR
jgi:hypothetical protein